MHGRPDEPGHGRGRRLNDGNGSTGQLSLLNVCPGAYTITETFSPPGLAVDGDPTRAVDVTSAASDTVGTSGDNGCSSSVAPHSVDGSHTDGDEVDFCNRPAAARSISWEKRRQSTTASGSAGSLVGGATLEFSGWKRPLACRGQTANPLVVVDDGPFDSDSDDGQFTLNQACSGIYTITETVAPEGFFVDPDPTRVVNVTGGIDSVSGAGCPDSTPATDDEEQDFCNPQTIVGSIAWEKRNHSNGALLGGATFTVGGTSGPFACYDGLTNPVPVADNGVNDLDPDAGQLLLENVCPGAYSVIETVPPATFDVDPDDQRTVTVGATGTAEVIGTMNSASHSSLVSCPDPFPGSDDAEQDFCDPLAPTNSAPVADNDSYNATEDVNLVVAAPGVLAGDTDADSGDVLSVTAASPLDNVDHGVLTLNANGSFTYDPADDYCGPDSFTYRAEDDSGEANDTSNTATVSITVVCVNDPPVATDDDATGTEDTDLTIAKATLLANDSDGGDGGALSLTAVSSPSGGTVEISGSNVVFHPAANLCGSNVASFQYTVSDGTDTDIGSSRST